MELDDFKAVLQAALVLFEDPDNSEIEKFIDNPSQMSIARYIVNFAKSYKLEEKKEEVEIVEEPKKLDMRPSDADVKNVKEFAKEQKTKPRRLF